MPEATEYTIRRAHTTLAEAEALLAVEQASTGDSPYAPAQLLEVMGHPDHHTYVAARGAQIVGFCACFETVSSLGLRLEIDLLGVHPAARRKGLAGALVARAVSDGRARGVRVFRGIVAEDNIASQRAFAHGGLEPQPPARALLVYAIHGRAPLPSLPAGWRHRVERETVLTPPGRAEPAFDGRGPGREAHQITDAACRPVAMAECLQVHTFSYAGIWVERLWTASETATRTLARALVERARALGLDEVGYLCPDRTPQEELAATAWFREGYERYGCYLVCQG